MLDRPLKILVVSPEVVPFAKTGGLADVAGSLPKALSVSGTDNMGNDVKVILPHYRGIEGTSYLVDFPVSAGDRVETAILRESSIEAQYQGEHRVIQVYLVDNYHFFDREKMYGYDDDAERFTFFCRAVLEMLPEINWQPDIIHCNDWQSGPIPFFLKVHYGTNSFYERIATVFTIHNLQYQGNFPPKVLKILDVDENYFVPEKLEFYKKVSYIKMGIRYSDVINTVSQTYAREIQRPEFGEGMDGLLRQRSQDLYGIVNGINYHEFNPDSDPRIYRRYNRDTVENKRENKYGLQKEMNLPVRDVPVIGLISRLADQKGLDLVAEVVEELMREDIQLVVLGSGEPEYEGIFKGMKTRFPEKIGVYIGFNAVLAQRIYAGADMFLMPSRFEPCGLGQLISMRYGTIPIVRSTGGLADTVNDYNPSTGSGNGFSFVDYDSKAMHDAIMRALDLYRRNPEQWRKLMVGAMEIDYSWAHSAVEYLQLYKEAITRHQERAHVGVA